MYTESMRDGYLVTEHEGDKLEIPVTHWGHPDVRMNGSQIPSARIWEIIANHLCEGLKVPREMLVAEARRAKIYQQLEKGLIVHTLNPKDKDILVDGSVYVRVDMQRIRPLVDRFSIKIAKIEGEYTAEKVKETNDAMEELSFYPVAAGEDKIMYSRDPEEVFEAFGTRDWVRLAVYFRRPGSSFVNLDLR